MKILVISDLHNDVSYTKAAVDLFQREKYDKMYVLGDILEDSIRVLNTISEHIVAVLGNCDSYDEEEIAKFRMPYLNYDYAFGKLIVLSHGHYYSPYNYDKDYDVFLMGHTHISGIYQDEKGHIIANPGSLSQPRDGIHSYLRMDEKGLAILDFNSGETIHFLDDPWKGRVF